MFILIFCLLSENISLDTIVDECSSKSSNKPMINVVARAKIFPISRMMRTTVSVERNNEMSKVF